MKNKLLTGALVAATSLLLGACATDAPSDSKATAKVTSDFNATASPKGTDVFKPDWKNIAEHYQFPEWFQDAKFGIFIHWGVYSVPAFGSEWYPRNMYQKNKRRPTEYNHHIATYGPHTEFGYKDFIPMFKAEKFNAEEWVALFKEAGAKYVVPVAEHHDGFAMYDSANTPWNAVKMGPKKDIIALLKKATDDAGLVFGLSSHRLENNWFYNGGLEFPSDVSNDKDKKIKLYGLRLKGAEQYGQATYDDFLRHTHELIDQYQPQLIWFDWTVASIQPAFNKFMAYYYNNALDWKKGVVVNTKSGYPSNIQVGDVERGKLNEMRKYPWQTDTSIGKRSWSYVNGEENKTPAQIVHDLIDIVSKNGNLLLNIGPKADGTITDEQKTVLLAIGKWLKVNGEGIYGTRCWIKYGEGKTKGKFGGFTDSNATKFTAQDLRFTTKGDALYVFALQWTDSILVKSLNKNTIADAKLLGIQLLGSDEKIKYEQTDEGLKIYFPKNKPCDFAYTFKLIFDKKVGSHLPSEAVDKAFKHRG